MFVVVRVCVGFVRLGRFGVVGVVFSYLFCVVLCLFESGGGVVRVLVKADVAAAGGVGGVLCLWAVGVCSGDFWVLLGSS